MSELSSDERAIEAYLHRVCESRNKAAGVLTNAMIDEITRRSVSDSEDDFVRDDDAVNSVADEFGRNFHRADEEKALIDEETSMDGVTSGDEEETGEEEGYVPNPAEVSEESEETVEEETVEEEFDLEAWANESNRTKIEKVEEEIKKQPTKKIRNKIRQGFISGRKTGEEWKENLEEARADGTISKVRRELEKEMTALVKLSTSGRGDTDRYWGRVEGIYLELDPADRRDLKEEVDIKTALHVQEKADAVERRQAREKEYSNRSRRYPKEPKAKGAQEGKEWLELYEGGNRRRQLESAFRSRLLEFELEEREDYLEGILEGFRTDEAEGWEDRLTALYRESLEIEKVDWGDFTAVGRSKAQDVLNEFGNDPRKLPDKLRRALATGVKEWGVDPENFYEGFKEALEAYDEDLAVAVTANVPNPGDPESGAEFEDDWGVRGAQVGAKALKDALSEKIDQEKVLDLLSKAIENRPKEYHEGFMSAIGTAAQDDPNVEKLYNFLLENAPDPPTEEERTTNVTTLGRRSAAEILKKNDPRAAAKVLKKEMADNPDDDFREGFIAECYDYGGSDWFDYMTKEVPEISESDESIADTPYDEGGVHARTILDKAPPGQARAKVLAAHLSNLKTFGPDHALTRGFFDALGDVDVEQDLGLQDFIVEYVESHPELTAKPIQPRKPASGKWRTQDYANLAEDLQTHADSQNWSSQDLANYIASRTENWETSAYDTFVAQFPTDVTSLLQKRSFFQSRIWKWLERNASTQVTAEGDSPPYDLPHEDALAHEFFGRHPSNVGPPVLEYEVGDTVTLEELDQPIVNEYLDELASERFGIENFVELMNGEHRKNIVFVNTLHAPHAVWRDDSNLEINLAKVKNNPDLMSVLIHDFIHVMTSLAREPMSEKSERKDAPVDEYVEFPEEEVAYAEQIKFMSRILRMTRLEIEAKLLDIVGRESSNKVDEWITLVLGAKLPETETELYSELIAARELGDPDTVIIESEYYPKGLSKEAIWRYYDQNKEQLVESLAGSDVMTVVKAGGLIYRRKADTGDGNIRIGSVEEFDHYNTGRTVEFHKVVSEVTNYGYVDIDPKEKVPFDKVRRITADVYDWLIDMPGVERVELTYSGGRGCHVYPYYNKPKPVDEARVELRTAMDKYIEQSGDAKLATGQVKESDMTRLDTSTLHRTGSLRVVGSLNATTGLKCTPLSRGELSRFRKESAKIKTAASVLPSTEEAFLEELLVVNVE